MDERKSKKEKKKRIIRAIERKRERYREGGLEGERNVVRVRALINLTFVFVVDFKNKKKTKEPKKKILNKTK